VHLYRCSLLCIKRIVQQTYIVISFRWWMLYRNVNDDNGYILYTLWFIRFLNKRILYFNVGEMGERCCHSTICVSATRV
jgi:hypothetical protein